MVNDSRTAAKGKARVETTESEKAAKDGDQVVIFIDQHAVRLDKGKYTGAQLKAKGNVPPGNLLYRVDGAERHEVGDTDTVEVHEGERFVSAPPVGGAS